MLTKSEVVGGAIGCMLGNVVASLFILRQAVEMDWLCGIAVLAIALILWTLLRDWLDSGRIHGKG